MRHNVQYPVNNGYVAPNPATDQSLALLTDQTTQQRDRALQDDVAAINAKHALMYGQQSALGTGGGFLSISGLPDAQSLVAG